MSKVIAERSFIVESSRERVWDLIGKVIFRSLPGMENIVIVDESNFEASLKMKVLLLELRMKLKGQIVDMSPPDSLAVKLAIEGPGGLFRIILKVTIVTPSIEEGRTAVACQVTAERMGILLSGLSLGYPRRFSQSTFEAIENRLKDLV
jgi:carbon monoxide dehydrogenase subunit G